MGERDQRLETVWIAERAGQVRAFMSRAVAEAYGDREPKRFREVLSGERAEELVEVVERYLMRYGLRVVAIGAKAKGPDDFEALDPIRREFAELILVAAGVPNGDADAV